MPLTTLPTKLTRQISQLLETRTPNSHAVLRTCLRPDALQVLSPLLIPIAFTTRAQEDALETTYTPADANDKSLLRRLRRCGLIAHPRVAVIASPFQRAIRTLSYSNRCAIAAASAGRIDMPKEVFVGRWDTVGVFFADHVAGGDGLGGNAFSLLRERDELLDTVWGLLRDRRVNIHVHDRLMPLEMVAGDRLVGVVRVLLFGRDEGDKDV